MYLNYIFYKTLLIFASMLSASCYKKGSLAFVIDNTHSMIDVINKVKEMTESITKIVYEEKGIQIDNMVLVTFNDPYAKLETVTADRNIFQKKIMNLHVHNNYGNNDCPEMSMTGLSLALENSLPGSFVYVFTDASAKDHMKSNDIIKMCQEKQTQIVFVMTGYCSEDLNKPPFQVYYDVAAACSGLVVYVREQEVSEMYATIKDALIDKKALMISRVIPAYKNEYIPFVIHDQNEVRTVTATGTNLHMSIQGPGESTLQIFHQQRLTWLQNIKVLNLINLIPGTYILNVRSLSQTTVNVAAKSHFSFRIGFSELEAVPSKDLLDLPISRTSTHLFITVSDSNNTVQLTSVQFLDPYERVIETYNLPLILIENYFYKTPTFVTPSQVFRVAVCGVRINSGEDIRYISRFPVTPQPEKTHQAITMDSSTVCETVDENTTMTISRPKSDLLISTIMWNTTDQSITPIPQTIMADSSTISETVNKNTKLKTSRSTSDLPISTVTWMTTDQNVTPNMKPTVTISEGTSIQIDHDKSLNLTCKVTAYPKPNIAWSNNRGKVLKSEISTGQLPNEYISYLTLTKISKNITFFCIAHNKIGFNNAAFRVIVNKKSEENTTLKTSGPTSDLPISTITSTTTEQSITPTASETVDDNTTLNTSRPTSDLPIPTIMSTITDQRITPNVKPTVTIIEGTSIDIEHEKSLNLTCKVTAYPKPKIVWSNNRGKKLKSQTLSGQLPNEYINYLTLTKISKNKTLFCITYNKLGFGYAAIKVIVNEKSEVEMTSKVPQTIRKESSTVFETVDENTTLNISHDYLIFKDPEIIIMKSSPIYKTGDENTILNISHSTSDLPISINTWSWSDLTISSISHTVTTKLLAVSETIDKIITLKTSRPTSDLSVSSITSTAIDQSIMPTISETDDENTTLKSPRPTSDLPMSTIISTANQIIMPNREPLVVIAESSSIKIYSSGISLNMTCKVTGFPKPKILWLNGNGKTLKSQISVEILPNEFQSVLMLPEISRNETFFCFAYNKYDFKYDPFKVIINDRHEVLISGIGKKPIPVMPEGPSIDIEHGKLFLPDEQSNNLPLTEDRVV